MSNTIFGGIEGGGTHFKSIIAIDPKHILYEESFPTTSPSETVEKAIRFFSDHIKRGVEICSVGLGSFGPLDLNPPFTNFWIHHRHSQTGMV